MITGDDNVLPLITTEVRDGVLTIGSKSSRDSDDYWLALRLDRPLT